MTDSNAPSQKWSLSIRGQMLHHRNGAYQFEDKNCCSNYSSFRKEDKKPTKINAFPSTRKLPLPSELFWPYWKNYNDQNGSNYKEKKTTRDWRRGTHCGWSWNPSSIIPAHNAIEGFKGGRQLGTPREGLASRTANIQFFSVWIAERMHWNKLSDENERANWSLECS